MPASEANAELREYLEVREERRSVFPKAILVGAVSGGIGVAFRALLGQADAFRLSMLDWAHRQPIFGVLVAGVYGAIGALLALLVVRKWAPEVAGSGIPHLESVLHRHRSLRWATVLPAKFVGGLLAIGSGMALGREGPTVQMGGATGMGIAQWLRVGPRESLTLTAAGAGAGLSAAFNAPLSGVVFVLEELQRDFRPTVFGAAFLSAATADVVARLFTGQVPAFSAPAFTTPSLGLLPAFLLLGLICGVGGVLFNRGLKASLNLFAKLPPRYAFAAAALVGGLVGLAGYFVPGMTGGGHVITESALAGKIPTGDVPLLLGGRFLASIGSYGTGVPGGIFAPLLSLGALVGTEAGHVTQSLVTGGAPLGAFAAVGMAALFTSIVRAPLTGIVLVIEMTSSYTLMLPLLVGCFVAYAVAEAMGDLPIYEALLQRDLRKSGTAATAEVPTVLEVEVQPGARLDGLTVREAGLPPGVVLVSCREGGREWVPTADTRLYRHLRLTALVSPEAEGGLETLRQACEAPVTLR